MDKVARYKRPFLVLALTALLLIALSSVGPGQPVARLPASTSTDPPFLPQLNPGLVAAEQPTRKPPPSPPATPPSTSVRPPAEVDRSGLRCALQDGQYFHEEVWGAALYSLAQWGCDLSLFHLPYHSNFETVTAPLWANPKGRTMSWPGGIIGPLERGEIDLLFITSGDDGWIDEDVLAAMIKARRTQIVIIMHQIENFGPERKSMVEIARQGRLTFAGLGESTADLMNHRVSEWAMEDAEVAWDRVPVEVFVPIFPLHFKPASKTRKIPSKVVIQGKIAQGRRDYEKIIKELHKLMMADPNVWGYHLPADPTGPFNWLSVIDGHPDVFELHLVGQIEMVLDIPDELRPVVQVHTDLSYDEYYRTLASMDLLLPAFASLHYLRDKTSSSIPAAVLSRVPVLGSALMVKVYEFLRSPAIVPYPAGLSEVQSIKLLREGKSLWDAERDLYVPLDRVRGNEVCNDSSTSLDAAWDAYHRSIYAANEQIWERTAARMVAQRAWIDRLEG